MYLPEVHLLFISELMYLDVSARRTKGDL